MSTKKISTNKQKNCPHQKFFQQNAASISTGKQGLCLLEYSLCGLEKSTFAQLLSFSGPGSQTWFSNPVDIFSSQDPIGMSKSPVIQLYQDVTKLHCKVDGATVLYVTIISSWDYPWGCFSWKQPFATYPQKRSLYQFREVSPCQGNTPDNERAFSANCPRKRNSLNNAIFMVQCAGTKLAYRRIYSGQYVILCKIKPKAQWRCDAKMYTREDQTYRRSRPWNWDTAPYLI